MLTQELLKSILDYNLDTGIFTWKVRMGSLALKGEVAGTKHKEGYICIMILGKEYKAHRLAFLYVEGNFPEVSDHINGIRDDNRWSNLRACSKLENAHNRKLSSLNTSGHKGVSYSERYNKWVGRVTYKGNQYMKRFKTIEEAIEFVKVTRESLHKEFANFGKA